MESDSADDAGEAVRGAPLIFISDASAEAERLTSALRAQGYLVTDVPLSVLSGRITVQRPDLVLFDADADGFSDTFARLRENAGDPAVHVVLVGDRNGPIAQIQGGSVAGVFARPVNVRELVGTVERLIGPGVGGSPKSLPPSARSSLPSSARSSLPPSARNGGRVATSSRPPARTSVGPSPRAPSDRARNESSVSPPPLPPDLGGDPVVAPREASDAPTVELSGDIQRILLDAEARLRDGPPAPSGRDDLEPEIETESPLAADVLAALDEPLDDEDVFGDGTPVPSIDGTGALTGSRASSVRGTTVGGMGMGTASGGTEAAPASDRRAATSAGEAPQIPPAELTDDARLARQAASTPRPPKPGPEGVEPGSSIEPPPRPSAPPVTSPEHAVPEPPMSIGTSVLSSSNMRQANPTEPPAPSAGPRPRFELTFDSDPPDRRDQSSTAPPLRRREHVEDDEPEPPSGPETAPPSPRRATERPSSSRAERPSRRPSERPVPKTEPPARRDSERPPDAREEPDALLLPPALRSGDAIAVLAKAIVARHTGTLAFEVDEGIRRVVFRDGDFVTVTSGVHNESLVAFLVSRGDLPAEVARQSHKLPPFGRRAGAALIAHGHLAQDQLWPVLRGHAEWLIGRILGIERGTVVSEEVGRFQDEPAVFGGATGAEVLVEVTRRVLPVEDAVERLGGVDATLTMGSARALLAECALVPVEAERIQHAENSLVKDLLAASLDPSFGSALLALVALGVLHAEGPRRAAAPGAPKPVRDEIDDAALRTRILARKALVDDGDYFAVLGVARDATSYDIRRAYTTLRRELDPHHVLTANTVDLGDVVDEIVAVLEEAYQILSDQRRRDRYRRAIEASP